MRGIALLKVVSAAALLLQASAQSLKELLSAPFAGTEPSADGVSTPPDAAAAPATPRKKGRCTNQDRECEVDDDCNFKKAWRAAYGIGTCQGGEGRRRRRTKRTPAPVALNAPTPSPTPRPTPRPTVDAAERKAAATRRCAASARRPVVDAGALDVLLVVPGCGNQRVRAGHRAGAASMAWRGCWTPSCRAAGRAAQLGDAPPPRLHRADVAALRRRPRPRRGHRRPHRRGGGRPAPARPRAQKQISRRLPDFAVPADFERAAYDAMVARRGAHVAGQR